MDPQQVHPSLDIDLDVPLPMNYKLPSPSPLAENIQEMVMVMILSIYQESQKLESFYHGSMASMLTEYKLDFEILWMLMVMIEMITMVFMMILTLFASSENLKNLLLCLKMEIKIKELVDMD